ncbi:TPA: KpsF/GutQ family sugar-phosphate isomerase [Vibrio parahaemolyticus]|uniref:KpsF/GutQ family sugar-phosphate isomerase n=1 Tax=Vibrio parahaemolyticus TaxID=670 RepID=UPI00226A0BEE|nr:KpsF/GutQ family sugar-phosphate isomerase [Vibrio parahaemolyticus]MCX8925352.1 KpsF/GutQ family sugar-phosphate isomerase [Vibrio parahaemolyticus]HCG8183291.1 KpsF/GutQ family sugar-phosphate isomerase [Vibrio parahaemolyticus]HCG9431073.1 KpsF/GutQ family sugar-phosphate isomerase [Vibrio parahaemolyticus]HCG9628197.1 KpsF/GutQ family sugar-phosphate isomerase [Vibrio parahaemolyticus]HCH3555662.1 KpsF/GutQ family sugar-phosphate isomerase [Vibrio parahaemolyticus]
MSSYIDIAQDVINVEISGLKFMSGNLGESFNTAIKAIISTNGRVIICGMGKSGIIGKKIAASFASTGTPSFFMHPGEAFHGDLGMVKEEDVFIAISNSGETDEVLKLLPFLRDNKNFVIAVTGNKNSTLAKNSHCHLDIAVPKEACPLQLAPTSSTTATLVMGDALTVALMEAREFQPENFARFHPGGSLGRKLLSRVRDEMYTGQIPAVAPEDSFANVVHAISKSLLGLTLVTLPEHRVGIITDGDLRRAIEEKGKDAFDLKALEITSSSPYSVGCEERIETAFEFMELKKVTSLIVYENDQVVGILKK